MTKPSLHWIRKGNGGELKEFFINATSFKKYINQIRIFLHDNPTYHLFGVAETRLSPCISDDVIQIQGFKVYQQDRNKDGDGVALYVRNGFMCEVLSLKKITTFWVICLNNLLQTIVIDKRKNTGTFIFGYAKDGVVRFSIFLPDFAWYLAWSMPSSQSTIVYPYFTLTN